ncbi:hypothetical protein AB0I53_20615 [Saccharopolyspora sp. NPDC050389]
MTEHDGPTVGISAGRVATTTGRRQEPTPVIADLSAKAEPPTPRYGA